MSRTFKDMKSVKRGKPTKKELRDLEKLQADSKKTFEYSGKGEFKSSYRKLKIEE